MALPNIVIDGRLVADVDLKFVQSGKAVANMRVAASDSKKDDAGNWSTTEQIFINVTLWEAEAETAAEHFVKGDRVLVAGRIWQREYEKSDGSKGYSLEVKFPTVAKIPATPKRADTGAAWSSAPAPANDPWGSVGGGTDGTQPPF